MNKKQLNDIKDEAASWNSERVCAQEGSMNCPNNKLTALLFRFNKGKTMRNVLGSSKTMKQEVCNYVIWLSDHSKSGIGMSMARYVLYY